MPLAKIEAKLRNIDRIIKYGKKDVLQIVDRDTREVLANVKSWSYKRLNPIQKGAPSFSFGIIEDSNLAGLLSEHKIALNGRIHDVIVRNPPMSVSENEWNFRTSPTNSFVIE